VSRLIYDFKVTPYIDDREGGTVLADEQWGCKSIRLEFND